MSNVSMKVLEWQEAAQLHHKTPLTCSNRLCGGKKKQIRGKALSQFTRGVPQHISLNHSHDLSPHLAHIAIATIATGHKHTGSSTAGQCTGVYLTTQEFPPRATGSSHRAAIVPAPELQLRVSCKEILSNLSGCGWWWWNGGQMC